MEAPKTSRRPRFSDRWQNSGGRKGSRDMRLNAEWGVRRRYGTVTIQSSADEQSATGAAPGQKREQLHYYECVSSPPRPEVVVAAFELMSLHEL